MTGCPVVSGCGQPAMYEIDLRSTGVTMTVCAGHMAARFKDTPRDVAALRLIAPATTIEEIDP